MPAFLGQAGFDTYLGAGFINPFLALQGWFETHRVYGDADAETIITDYQDWRTSRERTYAYLQLSGLHAPIEPPAEYARKNGVDGSLDGLSSLEKYANNFEEAPSDWREQRLSLYQVALEYIEDILQKIISDLMNDTLLIVIGDHGEGCGNTTSWINSSLILGRSTALDTGKLHMIARVPAAIRHPNRDLNASERGCLSGRDLPKTVSSGLGIEDSSFGGMSWFEAILLC
ncbi:hypothetical protein GCM10008994_21400 [Halorubrum ejinorense]|uniref:Sulfatase N-terminal domain-containing protein n=1 Tax=Halorubrum ejinorense TaxID=425309 RepID=A0AAV3SU33_9EURY